MPAVQTVYQEAPSPAYAGMRANQEPHVAISRVVASPSIAFGVPVCQGPGDDQVVAATAGAAFRGISMADPVNPPTLAAGQTNAYAQGRTAAVMTKGVVWVVASAAVTVGQGAFFDPATGNVSGDNTKTAINGLFDSTAPAGALAKLRLV